MAPYTDIYTRTLVIALKSPPSGKNTSQVSALTGVHPRTVDRIYSRAIAAGFEPNDLPIKILPHHVQDAPKPGRPAKQAEVKEQILQQVRHDRYGREKSCADLAGGLKDWKNVIWTDETSVVINHRRGGYRVWRKADERVVKSCIRERWKGYSEFMFWGCFLYDKKGPCHIYQLETKAEREDAARRIEQLNAELEPLQREEWELSESMRRTGLRNKRGRKPQWRWTEKTGKLVRKSGGGIDWWRYQACVLIPKLIPFAKECLQDRPRTVRLLWCGNSPDCNCIEPCWFYMKRETTKKGAPQSRAEAVRVWQNCLRDLSQLKIQAWIERILVHIQKIIELQGGNEYIEGRDKPRLRRPHFG
ncbi:uncharacterized protein SETTUDRAFT_87293 [Exserohilum turcica Et28A]|uniref:Uncharacterized protein n=1 Tax=Exserohilum turcicum (strain 28A) TaxID=671987 RepID=R0KFF0_EXST2|nr:uncharacterized protein SETTUDRAFT_87293 [Exserohilum turcica Et28A]EOA86837.1 hypothetical protein SETTUDRAFT_87293 [Exserohilum turcica Et28A]